ncbi:alpha-glucosidase [Sulfurimonas sp. HSL1-6]|uniref:glycoside hydrolase family 13 protein n=1 Tax=Thiomicrolovo immobilis TaxID=3131935 RepID=UPI0031F8620B
MASRWWERAVFYQVYPRSFADGNGDGIGDLPGIIGKLDYLQWLGVDALWLSPHYPSPQIDAGYDITDFTAVEPAYGTMADFDHLLEAIHARGMRLILDLVLNHTSDQHPWFLESRSNRENPKRDWYVWHDGDGEGPPNNWQSEFGGSAWEHNALTGQWYYHEFLKEQPDLNWRNPEVKAAMFDVARFWLDKGVDGFRLDAIGTLYEDPALTPQTSRYSAIDVLRHNWLPKETRDDLHYMDIVRDLLRYQHEQPEVFALMRDFRALIDTYDDRFLVGETSDVRFLGNGRDALHGIFNFDDVALPELTPGALRKIRSAWQTSVPDGGAFCTTLNNHDQSRIATHFAAGERSLQQCRIALAVTLLLGGIPFLYYGEEIGMRDYAIQSLGELHDSVGRIYRDLRLQEGIGDAQILTELGTFSRDRCRTPMQWDRSPNAGFAPAGVRPWLPVHDNYLEGINVADQTADPDALLPFYRELLHLRRTYPALQTGSLLDLDPSNEALLVFLRTADAQRCLVILSFASEPLQCHLGCRGRILFPDIQKQTGIAPGPYDLPPLGVLIVAIEENLHDSDRLPLFAMV